MVRSRTEARRAIEEGRVKVTGIPTPSPATLIDPGAGISLEEARPFVSRGGNKLDDALGELDVEVEGRTWLDAGASTGGFTDRLLKGGAARVISIDVGYGQLDWSLRNDERVAVLERCNIRHLDPADLPYLPDACVADLSFISLRKVLPVLAGIVLGDGDFVLLVKPQFEVGRDGLGKGGVVRDPEAWRSSIAGVVGEASSLGLGLVDVVPSRWPGPAGNREFFVHLRRGEDSDMTTIERAVRSVVGE